MKKNMNLMLHAIKTISLVLVLGLALSACAQTRKLGADTWKEEVLLHDDRKIMVTRSQTYGGRHEIGQPAPVKEHSINFKLPGSIKSITWVSEYGEDLGRTNFKLLALHVLKDTPYLVAVPNLCLAYNKWGRPNPPYVIFKLEAEQWTRIALNEFPSEFKDNNLVINNQGEAQILTGASVVTAEFVKKLNDELTQPEYKTILREKINYDPQCIPMVSNGKGVWRATAWFETKPTFDACLTACFHDNYDEKHCPCNSIFQRK